MSRVLVTGCNGYVGRHLVPALTAAGHDVSGLDRAEAEHRPEVFHHGDLNHPDLVRRAVDGVDMVVHLAAAKDDWGLSDAQYHRDNVDATAALVEAGAAAGVRDWLVYSTVGVYGPSDGAADESAPHQPDIPYGRTKAAAEEVFTGFAAREPGARVLVVRPSVVFGPGHPAITNVYRLIDALHRRRFLQVGNGDAVKATSYIENLVAATVFLLDHFQPGLNGYIYTDEPRWTTGQMVSEISRLIGRKPPRWHLPLGVAAPIALAADAAAKLTGRNLPITSARIEKFNTATDFSSAKLRGLGFHQPVEVAEAFRRTVAWQLAAAG